MKQKIQFFSLILVFLCQTMIVNAQENFWNKITISNKSKSSKFQNLDSKSYQIFSLDFNAFKEQFKSVIDRNQIGSKSNVIVNFPNVKGELEEFRIYEAPVLTKELSKMYPRLKTYVGYSTDGKGTRIRFSVTPHGVQTMTSYLDKATVFTVPVGKGTNTEYITYTRNARIESVKDFECLTEDELVPVKNVFSTKRDANDQMLRTFRIAISVSGEYTDFWDDGNPATGTPQEDALAQVISTLNRNNEVFESDMAVTFTLVNGVQYNGSDLIFADAATDPYTGSPNNQLQSTLTSVVGEENYDIGHLFLYGSNNGNAGCIGCVCVDGQKGSGFSGHSFTDNDGGAYMNDFFDIDYVPHEIGHQMGGNHTFSQSNEGTGVNAEPGSGTTIMGYAGITGNNDVQDHSDAYFHYNTINQILNNLETRTCWVGTAITNNPPVSDAGSDYTIPQGTAFVLKGAATDPDSGDVLTYTWEQIDDGGSTTTSANFGPTRTDGPLFRSRPPSISPNRYMPILSRVVSGELTETDPLETVDNSSWETVATVAREMNFALTIRDRSEAGGTGQMPQTDFDTMKVMVDATAGPFAVTSQTTNEMWDAGSSQTITWDVAGTDAGNVNTPTVNILLSVDGGVTFPHIVATNVPNDGSHNITVPATGGDTTTARVIVEGNNNIFFAMNSTNFSIQESEFALSVANPDINVCSPNDAVYNFTYNTFLDFTGTTTFSASGLPSGATATFNPTTATADGTAVTATISGIGSVAQGSYNFTLVGTSGAITKSADVSLGVYSGIPGSLTLTSPSDGNTGESFAPTLMWNADSNSASYDVEVATDNAFTNIISSGNVTTNSYALSGLNQSTTYYWRVRGKNTCGEGSFSSTFSFTTLSCTICPSNGNTTFDTGTTLVKFNTIDNASGKPSGYSDYTAISTTVKQGDSHTITVNANTDGSFITSTSIWIDWNQDCDFDDADEEYDLGFVFDSADEPTSLSPLSITIPNTAVIGSTIMRVSTKYLSAATYCQTDFDGEVEDYTVIVESPTASIEDFAFSGFNLYPNPSTGEFTLKLELIDTEKVSVQLFDIRGRLINEKNFLNTNANFSERINFNHTAKGLYLVKITNGNKQTTRKLVIE